MNALAEELKINMVHKANNGRCTPTANPQATPMQELSTTANGVISPQSPTEKDRTMGVQVWWLGSLSKGLRSCCHEPMVLLGERDVHWTRQLSSHACVVSSPENLTNDGNQGGLSLKDPLQVLVRPITRSRAKKIKEAMQGLVQSTWDEASKSPTIKVGLKEGEPILIHLIQAVEDMT
uniref:Uncharacterized protein n=1 Tax=Fagus sylvatica TaxID=28930 RepID=A0A2N9HLN3_FAGSY